MNESVIEAMREVVRMADIWIRTGGTCQLCGYRGTHENCPSNLIHSYLDSLPDELSRDEGVMEY